MCPICMTTAISIAAGTSAAIGIPLWAFGRLRRHHRGDQEHSPHQEEKPS